MRRLSGEEYAALIAGGQPLASDRHGVKVLVLPDGTIVKLFRRKRLFSSALFRPYAARFVHAAQRLAALGVPTIRVIEAYTVPSIDRHAVHYHPLRGRTLRQALAESVDPAPLLEALALLMADLHHRGVYFRALHLGNVVELEDRPGALGLIDVSEASVGRRPLGPGMRARNFKPLLRVPGDRQTVLGFGFDRFVGAYLEAAGLSGSDRQRFLRALARPPLAAGG